MKVFCLIISFALTYGAILRNKDVEFPFQKDHRIIGGHQVSIKKHPHQISLRFKQYPMPNFTHICGGSIYNEYAIITAAHCMIGTEETFLVTAGTDVRDSSDCASSRVRKIVKHPMYNVTIENSRDIAIMFLEKPLPINNVTIAAIPLVTEPPKDGQKAITSGWGRTTQGGDISTHLNEVEVPIVQNDICSVAYKPQIVSHDMLCAGVLITGGKDSCQGDSGGPLLIDHKLAGVISWGIGCALGQYPGIYTNVYEFRDWIIDTVEQNKI